MKTIIAETLKIDLFEFHNRLTVSNFAVGYYFYE
jgi:hypothetical protein